MSISIYTFNNPYKLDEEPEIWNALLKSPVFCVSQTTVNGLVYYYNKKNKYHEFEVGRLTTIKNLIDQLYDGWMDSSCAIKQYTDIDELLNNYLPTIVEDVDVSNVKKSFQFNREGVFESLRTMYELGMNSQEILENKLTREQLYLVKMFYRILQGKMNEDFTLPQDFTKDQIDNAIINAIEEAAKYKKNDSEKKLNIDEIDKETIVIFGVHQFSSIALRAIEEISKYKNVMMVFNYQNQYSNMYQTWIDIYSAFDMPMHLSKSPNAMISDAITENIQGITLADQIGCIANGIRGKGINLKSVEILEFDNMTEFADYIARIYEKANKEYTGKPIRNMKEQFYTANNDVNEILKIYFPEQFGERQFLNYPLGQFIVAIANMWDSEENKVKIKNFNDIKDCFSANIIKENYPGELNSIFTRMEPLFEGCEDIEQLIRRIKGVMNNRNNVYDQKIDEYLSHITYYKTTDEECKILRKALKELRNISIHFYEDFQTYPNNFQKFYSSLKQYLIDNVLNGKTLDDEFRNIVLRVLDNLDEAEKINVTASFECLKATMSIYLKQDENKMKGAKWIARNFEQIDGDILLSERNKDAIYHFGCLSDEDMIDTRKRIFPWPLDDNFFEVAQDPIDWKYQVYVRSKKEYTNFKKYALLYGLQFNKAKFKLSYVKRDNDKVRQPYYLLNVLGIKSIPYIKYEHYETKYMDQNNIYSLQNELNFDKYDYFRFRICKYKFFLESILENNTVYKDSFLLKKYFEVIVENEVKYAMQNCPMSSVTLRNITNEKYDEFKKYFPFVVISDRMDITNTVVARLEKAYPKGFKKIDNNGENYMYLKELFLHISLRNNKKGNIDVMKSKFDDVTKDKIDAELCKSMMEKETFEPEQDLWCVYCANKEICTMPYGLSKEE